jgi:hypothetical protein
MEQSYSSEVDTRSVKNFHAFCESGGLLPCPHESAHKRRPNKSELKPTSSQPSSLLPIIIFSPIQVRISKLTSKPLNYAIIIS